MPKSPHTTRLDDSLFAKIEEIAKASGKTPSLVIHQLIEAGLTPQNSIPLDPELYKDLENTAASDDRTAENLAQHLLRKALPRYRDAIKTLDL